MDKLPLKPGYHNDTAIVSLSSYDKLMAKIDSHMKQMNEFTKQNQSVVKSVVKDKVRETADRHMIAVDFKTSLANIVGNSVDGMFKSIINPKSGGILDQVFEGRREKRLEKTEEKKAKKEFREHYFENTKVGRAIKDRPDAVQIADKLFDQIKSTKMALDKQNKLIDKKEAMAEKFGVGGPLAKDIKLSNDIQNQLKELLKSATDGKKSTDRKDESVKKNREETEERSNILDENNREAIQLEQDSVDLLNKIEVNTRKSDDGSINDKKIDTNLNAFSFLPAGLVAGLSSIAGNILRALLAIFSPKALLKVFSKVLLPVAIVASVVNGIMDGFDEFKKSGSIKKALIAGFGGVLDFLTFGLFDKTDVEAIFNKLSAAYDSTVKFVSENIIEPIMNSFNTIKDYMSETMKPVFDKIISLAKIINDNIIQPMVSFFTKVITSIKDVLKSIKIPQFNVGPWEFGPWQPFNFEDTTVSQPKKIEVVPSNSGEQLIKNTQEIEEIKSSKEKSQSSSAAPIISNNSTVNNKTTITTRKPVRNQDSSFNRYIVKA